MRSKWIGVVIVAAAASRGAVARAEPADGEIVGLPKNGLSSEAFLRNPLTTNVGSLEILRSYPLNQELLSEPGAGDLSEPAKARRYLRRQLHHDKAQAAAAELIKCALTAEDRLTYIDPSDGTAHTWQGELGLCRTRGDDWTKSRPTLQCQQRVTACLMARVNALQMAVPISLRQLAQPGEAVSVRARSTTSPPILLQAPAGTGAQRDVVRTEMTYRESPQDADPSEGTPIPEPEWTAAYVGTCTPGQRITLALPATSTASTAAAAGASRLRVCAGIHGCSNSAAVSSLLPGIQASPRYQIIPESPALGATAASTGTITSHSFECPSGPLVGGFYSIMAKHMATTNPTSRPLDVTLRSKAGAYPAKETEIFGFQEGAFYGNLFDTNKLFINCVVAAHDARKVACDLNRPVVKQIEHDVWFRELVATVKSGSFGRFYKGLPYADVHACYSAVLEKDSQNGALGVAYLNSRICALPGGEGACFPNKPLPCSKTCKSDAGVFGNCKSPGSPTKGFLPLTTYLNEPCDLIPDGKICKWVRAAQPRHEPKAPAGNPKQESKAPAGRPTTGSEDRATGPQQASQGCGCDRSLSCSAGGALQLLLPGAVVLGFLLRRRRPRRPG